MYPNTMYFRFFARKNAATGVLATGVLAVGNLLFNTSLAIFVFSLPKIVMWEQQLA